MRLRDLSGAALAACLASVAWAQDADAGRAKAAPCASCHGQNGKGGGIGPKLQGLPISIARVKAQIDGGGSTMPAGLVKGGDEADVLAYVATIVKLPSG